MQEQEINSHAANLAGILPGAVVYFRERRTWSLYNIPHHCQYKNSHLSCLLCNTQPSEQECVHIHPPLFNCTCYCYLPLCANRLPAPLMQAYRVQLSSMWPRTEALLCSAADRQADSSGLKAGKEEYLQRVPRPSVRECRRENRSLFISHPWTQPANRTGGGWMENV